MITLGIDIGTTKIAMVLLDIERDEILDQTSQVFGGAPCNSEGMAEVVVTDILKQLDFCALQLDPKLRSRVSAIGVTGQMHGIVFRNSTSNQLSNLITWQDQRCLQNGFIQDLQNKTGENNLHSGYGLSTMAWYQNFQPSILAQYNQAGTIQGLLVSCLCESNDIPIDQTNAASWGLYDLETKDWNYQALEKLALPENLIPKIYPAGGQCGELSKAYADRWKLPKNIPIMHAIGDNQASLFCTINNPQTQLALTLGTSGQLSSIIKNLPSNWKSWLTAEVRPYIDGQYALVAASLCGGSALSWLTLVIQNWCQELGLEPLTKDQVYLKLNQLSRNISPTQLIKISPNFLGERFDQSLKGKIEGINFNNFSLGEVFTALAIGVVQNLKEMLPTISIQNKSELVGSGNGLRRFEVFKAIIPHVFGTPLTLLPEREEAACGAALLAKRLVL